MRYVLAATLLALATSTTAIHGETDANQKTKQLQEAEKHLQRYEYGSAIHLLEDTIEGTPEPSSKTYQLLATAYRALARYDEAIAAADSMLETATDVDGRGTALGLLGQLLFEKTVDEDLENASLKRFGERLSAIAEESTEPSGLVQETLERRLENLELIRDTRLEEAAAALRQAIALQGDSAPMNHYRLAEVLTKLDRIDEAHSHLDSYFALTRGDDVPPGPRGLECMLESGAWSPDRESLGAAEKSEESRITPPRRSKADYPRYTRKAKARRLQGEVWIEAVIDEGGDVRCARPLRGLPLGLTARALKTVRDWEFEPALLDGEPVAVLYRPTVRFKLRRRYD